VINVLEVCEECYQRIMKPIWSKGGDCEVKSIALYGQQCDCGAKAVHLLSEPSPEFIKNLGL